MSIQFQSNEILLMNSDETHVRTHASTHARTHARTHLSTHLTHIHMLTIETYRVLNFFEIEFVLRDKKKYRDHIILNPLSNEDWK